ncbi:uncharacterized protein LOC116305448 [Actinia tenebrosa]|uniref:Uncharacterized protein LOC116305448 n=1 Tax=Actinia tenebrosa TaxID=6105 RepID=A0A6P8IV96_ACTTE|nr:uncharacterized protein LOC116305448 [Actinia tenebrosa]
MLGLEHLKLNEKDRNSLKKQWRTIAIQAEVSRKDLFQILEQRVKRDVIERLQFGLTESGQERPTSEKILLDDSNIYAKFGKTMLIVGRSALKMKAFYLRDRCQEIERSITNTIQTIANIVSIIFVSFILPFL